jgi:hypothetical protein
MVGCVAAGKRMRANPSGAGAMLLSERCDCKPQPLANNPKIIAANMNLIIKSDIQTRARLLDAAEHYVLPCAWAQIPGLKNAADSRKSRIEHN